MTVDWTWYMLVLIIANLVMILEDRRRRADEIGPPKLKVRNWRRRLWIAAALVVGSPMGFLVLEMSVPMGSGSPAEAARLRVKLEPVTDPDSGLGIDREYVTKRFPNGEWIAAICRRSHDWMSYFKGGGTVVLKDSRGRIRAFFGHCCGGEGGLGMTFSRSNSLDEFDALMPPTTFHEYEWP
ncbi:MAG: hypothetical protein ACRC1K_25115 [Planctomycetia bacterium]